MYRPRRFSSGEERTRMSQKDWRFCPTSTRPSSLSPSREISRRTVSFEDIQPRLTDSRQMGASSPWLQTYNQDREPDGVTIEELEDGLEMEYDADIEVRQPDEYDEADSEDEPPVSLLGIMPLNEANLAEHFRRLNCDPNQRLFSDVVDRDGPGSRPMSISRKRNRSRSMESVSDVHSGTYMGNRPKRRRPTRRIGEPFHRRSSIDDFNASTSPPEYSPVTTRSLNHVATPLQYHQTPPRVEAALEISDRMDIDGS